MRRIYFILLMAIFATSCASLITQKGKNVEVNKMLLEGHGDYNPALPLIYTIDTTFLGKAFSTDGTEQEKFLNLQNNSQNFGVVKSKPNTNVLIKGVANRPFDVFQAEVLPGTNIIKKNDQGMPVIKPLFRVNSIPKIGFQMFVRKSNPPVQDRQESTRDEQTTTTRIPQKGPMSPIAKVAVEYMLKCVLITDFEGRADNRFRGGTMYEVTWDKQAYPNMYKIVQRNEVGQMLETPINGDPGYLIIDSRYGDYLSFYYLDNGQPTIAYYNYDKPDALSLIGLTPVSDGWFMISPNYNNYGGKGWFKFGDNGMNDEREVLNVPDFDDYREFDDDSNNGSDNEFNDDQSGQNRQPNQPIIGQDFPNIPNANEERWGDGRGRFNDDGVYWDYPDKDPASYGKGGPRRLTDNMIRRDYPNGRYQFILPLLKRHSPNFFDELWRKGWIYPHQDTFNIDPNVFQRFFPEADANLNRFYPGSWRFIKTDNPLPRRRGNNKSVDKQPEQKQTEPKNVPGNIPSDGIDGTPLNKGSVPKTKEAPKQQPKQNRQKSGNDKNTFWDYFNFGK